MNTTPAARAFIIFVGAIVATGVLIVVLLFTTKGTAEKTVHQAEENFTVLKDQEALLRIVLAVTGCTVADTSEQCKAKVGATAAARDERYAAEVDCRIRLALAGAPAPGKGETCVPPPPTTTTTTTVPPPPLPLPPPPG